MTKSKKDQILEDIKKLNTHLAEYKDELSDEAKAELEKLRGNMKSKAYRYGEEAYDMVHNVKDNVQDYGREKYHNLKDRTQDEPVKSLAVAAGVGFASAVFLRFLMKD